MSVGKSFTGWRSRRTLPFLLADLLGKYLGRACLGGYGRVNFGGIKGGEILFLRGPWKMKYYRREAFRHANLPSGMGKLFGHGGERFGGESMPSSMIGRF